MLQLRCAMHRVTLHALPVVGNALPRLVMLDGIRLRHLWNHGELEIDRWSAGLPWLLSVLRPELARFAPLDADMAQFTTSHELSASMREVREASICQVRTLTGPTIHIMPSDLHGGLSATCLDLKILIQSLEGIPVDQQRLIFEGRQLNDDGPLASYGVHVGATLHLVLSLRGDTAAGALRAQPTHLGLRVWHEVLDVFHGVGDLGSEVANGMLSALAADTDGASLEVCCKRPLLVRRDLNENCVLTDAVTVWIKEELLGFLTVRRVMSEWCPEMDRALELIQPWFSIPSGQWSSILGLAIAGRTVRRFEADGSVCLQFQSDRPTDGMLLRTRLLLPDHLPDDLQRVQHDLMERWHQAFWSGDGQLVELKSVGIPLA